MKECRLCGRCLADHHDACPDDRADLRLVFAGPPLLDRKYRLLSRLGAGGMGAVYEAHHLGLDRRVAVKLLHPGRLTEPGARERFQSEARALARLDHPNIVRVLDFGNAGNEASRDTPDLPYLVMELLAASTLAERLRSGPLAPAAALPLLAGVAAALDHAHQAGILHRDLKASNVLLTETSGGEPVAKVVDFGLADFLADPEATPRLAPEPADRVPAADLLGTPAYLAPEAWRGEPPSPAADLWAFGVLAFFTLTGRLPFPGPGKDDFRRQIERGAPAPSAVHPGLDPALDAALLAPLEAAPTARPTPARRGVEGLDRAYLAARRRLWRRREVPRRMALAGLLAGVGVIGVVGTAGLAPLASPLAPVENRLVDARFALASPRPPRREPLLILIDDATLASDPTPLVHQAGAVGALLDRAFAAGARGVAIDFRLPPSWGDDPAFSDLVLRHADALVLAASSPPDRPVVGPEVLNGLLAAALGPERARRLFGFIDVPEDGDGVLRRARPLFRDVVGRTFPSFAARAARLLHPGLSLAEGNVWIDGTVDWRGFERLSFRDLGDALDRDPGRFRGRLALFGGDYTGSGEESCRIPHARGLPAALPGTVLQALLTDTLLDGSPVRSPGRAATLAVLFLLGFAVAAVALLGRPSLVLAAGPLAATFWTAAAFALFATHRLLVPIASPLAFLLLLAGWAALLRKWFPAAPHLLLEPS